MLPDHYKTLGLSPGATDQDIRKAYKTLVKIHHPDVVSPSEREKAAEHFKEIMLAYQVLNAPDKRKVYDAQMLAMKAALNERVRQYKQKSAAPQKKAEAPKASPTKSKATLDEERRQGERGDPTWRNNPRHGDKLNPKLKQEKQKAPKQESPAPKKDEPSLEVDTEQDESIQLSMFPWMRGETLYVVQHGKTQWHSTWMPDTRAWKRAVQKGLALFTFRDVDTDKVLLHTHIELPEDCSGEKDMLKLEVNEHATLYLNIERLPQKQHWFSRFEKKKLLKTKSRQQAKAHKEKSQPSPKAKEEASSGQKGASASNTSQQSEDAPSVAPPIKRQAKANQATIDLRIWEAVLGCTKEITLPSGEEGTVSVPAGIQHGQTLRFSAQDKKSYDVLVNVIIPKSLNDDQREAYVILKALDEAEAIDS